MGNNYLDLSQNSSEKCGYFFFFFLLLSFFVLWYMYGQCNAEDPKPLLVLIMIIYRVSKSTSGLCLVGVVFNEGQLIDLVWQFLLQLASRRWV
jgi:RsiW-degrading membrane proteinase PrsW (M82 family)